MEPKKDNVFECSAVTKWIEIEITSHCGLKCLVCAREDLESYHFMGLDTFKDIISLVKGKWYEEVMVCGLWDAFLHKDLCIFMDYLFQELPDINLFFMTKGQAITKYHLEYIKDLNERWYNVSLTFSVFSVTEKMYNYLTWGKNYQRFMDIITLAHNMKVNYSMEFLLSVLTLNELPKFKSLAEKLGKDYGVSLVHNWGWKLSQWLHEKLFDEKKLEGYYVKRWKWDICEVMKYDYLYFNALGEVFQCSLNEIDRVWYLWKIWEYSLEEFLERKRSINYKQACDSCFYYNYKTFS